MYTRGTKKKSNHFMVLLTVMALLFGNLGIVSTAYGAGLTLNGAFLGNSTTKMIENVTTANTNTPQQPEFRFNFPKNVSPQLNKNKNQFQLAKVSDSTIVPVNVNNGRTMFDILVTPSSPLEYETTYKITCKTGVASGGNGSATTDLDYVFYFTTIDKPATPTISSAVLSGNTLQLDGLASIGKDMEYYIDASGTADIGSVSVTEWVYMNTVSGATYSIALSNPNLILGTSKVYIHFKGDSTNTTAWTTVKGGFGTNISIAQGHTYAFEKNVNVAVPALIPASGSSTNPTINLRNAISEVPSNKVMLSLDYYVRLHPSGDVYGVTVNGANQGTSVQLSLPVLLNTDDIWLKDQDINNIRNNKMGVYLLDRTNPNAYRWIYQKSTDRSEIANNVIKVTADVQSANQDMIFGIFYDFDVPEAISYYLVDKTDHSLTIDFLASDESTIVQFDVVRTEVVLENGIPGRYEKSTDPAKKKSFTVTEDQIRLWSVADSPSRYKGTYTDTDVETGKIYNYEVMAAQDALGGRRANGFGGVNLTPDSDENIVQRAKRDILDPNSNYHLSFAPQDSADSVTQNLIGPLNWIVAFTPIKWSSSRPDIVSDINLHVNKAAVTDQVKVNVTAKITTGNGIAQSNATESVVIPVTVKWSEVATISDVRTNSTKNNYDEMIAAINSDTVKTIVTPPFNGQLYEDLTLDFKGKTVKLAPSSLGNLAFIGAGGDQGSKLTIRNVTLDVGGQPLDKVFDAYGDVTLDNVKVVGSENSKYGLFIHGYKGNVKIMNSSFAPVKVASIWQANGLPLYVPELHVSNSTFDGGGSAAYGIYSDSTATVENNTFKNYHSTDNSATGIFINNGVDASISGNTVTGSDIGIQVMTEGGNPSKINGISVIDKESAKRASDSLIQGSNYVGSNFKSVVMIDKVTGTELYKESSYTFIPNSYVPAAGAVNVPLDSTIQFKFAGNDGLVIDPNTLNGNITLTADGAAVSATVALDPSTNIVTITPMQKLRYGTAYNVVISKNIADKDGNIMPMDMGWKFTTSQFATLLNPVSNAPWDVEIDGSLEIGFAVPVNPDSILAGQSVLLQPVGGEAVGFKHELSADGKHLTITPLKEMVYGGKYKLTLAAPLSDTAGNTIGSPQSINFLTQTATVLNDPELLELGNNRSPVVTNATAGKNYNFGVSIKNNSNDVDYYSVYVTARAGKGARMDYGGKVLGSDMNNISLAPSKTSIARLLNFKVPSDATEVYFDVFICEQGAWYGDRNHILGKPAHFVYKVQQ
ncbi:Ig-like domain-containing protein [Paenibacillus sp. SI8]|uniref:Ig-like domain-containing protein n=1 Tax=unclassified Paenibacillus TaxID=185978 RepID=UPI00346557C9